MHNIIRNWTQSHSQNTDSEKFSLSNASNVPITQPCIHVPGADVGKGGRFAVGIFPEGLVLSQDCPNLHIYVLFHCVQVSLENS